MTKVASEMFEGEEVFPARKASAKKKSEQFERRRKRIQRIAKIAEDPNYTSDEKLILAYMFDEAPLHFRRTLDQYYYYNVPTTEARDVDQVVSRYYEKTWPDKKGRDNNLLLMVDQLWLWILDEGLFL